MSRVDITATAAMAMWQERIEKERAHAQTRRAFTTNPKTMYVITEKPHATAWSREFQAHRAEEQAKLDTPDLPIAGYYSPLTPMLPGAAAALAASAASANAKHTYKPKGGAAPVTTAVAITSPLTHTTTIVGTGNGPVDAPPATPPPQPRPHAHASASSAAAATATATASPSKSPAKWSLTNAGAAIINPSNTLSGSQTLSGTAKKSLSATGNADLTHTHTRAATIRRAHPLATTDPALAATLRRTDLAPTEKWEWPQTTNHEYGWNTAPVMPPDRATVLFYKGLKSSDISEYVSNYVTTQGGKTPFSTQTSANRPPVA